MADSPLIIKSKEFALHKTGDGSMSSILSQIFLYHTPFVSPYNLKTQNRPLSSPNRPLSSPAYFCIFGLFVLSSR